MKIEDKVLLTNLFYIYKDLLSSKQEKMFELYFIEDYSLLEISKEYNISKNGVYNHVKRVEEMLLFYEDKLKVWFNYLNNKKILEEANVDEKIIEKIRC